MIKISPFCPKILPKLDDKNLSFIQKTVYEINIDVNALRYNYIIQISYTTYLTSITVSTAH